MAASTDAPVAGSAPGTAQTLVERLAARAYSGRAMDLVVRDAPLTVVLAEIERVAGLRLDVDPAVRSRASYEIRQVPWDEVLARVLADHALNIDAEPGGGGCKVFRGRKIVLVFTDPGQARAVAYLYRYLTPLTAGGVLLAAVAFAALWAKRRPAVARVGAKKALLAPERAQEVSRRLRALMEDDRLYTCDDLTLAEVAGRLGVTAHQLSWLVNEALRSSFASFVNGYRVEEAKRRLASPGRRGASVLRVGLDAGFGTKAAFNRAFKRHTGMTPSQFRAAARAQHAGAVTSLPAAQEAGVS